MAVEFDIRGTVLKYSALGAERLRIIQHSGDFALSGIRRGVVFVFAVWSGPSVQALQRFTRVLATIELGSLDVIILDNDCITDDDKMRVFGHVFHGAGEVLWIRDGQVIAELSAYRQESEPLILSHTKALLV